MAKRNGAIKLEGAASNGDNKKVKFSEIEINEDFNVRKVYPKKSMEELVESIKGAGGLLNPLIVSQLPTGKYYLLGGFRRSRALRMIYGDENVMEIEVPVRVISYTNDADSIIANLAIDSGHEPVRKYDLADRLAFLREEKKLENKVLAARTGLGHMTVSQLITCRTKLHNDIVEAWKAAPTPEQEIKFTHLLEWSRMPHEDQLVAFKKYMEDHAADEGEEGEDGPKKKKKSKAENKATQKLRTKKQLSTQLEKFEEKKDELEGEKLGAYRALRWALTYTEKLVLSS